MVLNGTEWYWTVLNGIPLADFYKGVASIYGSHLGGYLKIVIFK